MPCLWISVTGVVGKTWCVASPSPPSPPLRAAITMFPSVLLLQQCVQTGLVSQLKWPRELHLLPGPLTLPPTSTQTLTEVGHLRPHCFAGCLGFWRMTPHFNSPTVRSICTLLAVDARSSGTLNSSLFPSYLHISLFNPLSKPQCSKMQCCGGLGTSSPLILFKFTRLASTSHYNYSNEMVSMANLQDVILTKKTILTFFPCFRMCWIAIEIVLCWLQESCTDLCPQRFCPINILLLLSESFLSLPCED